MKFSLSRPNPSEEFKLSVRSFESGVFEEARKGFFEVLRRDPTDQDALYFLRLIERRVMPISPPGPATLIWQCDPTRAWESDWVRSILSGSFSAEIIDTKWATIAPRMLVVDSGLVEEKVAYYRAAFYRGCRIVLIHLSDEAFRDDTGAYRYCEAVLRNYRSDIHAASTGIHFFPLGYKSGFARPFTETKQVFNRRFLWSFAGDAKKSTRRPMLEAMNTLPGGFVHLTEGFGSGDSLSTEEYRVLLEDTVVAPCPSGWSNLETFRVYEALEAGCIPIVERRPAFEYFADLLGAHPLPTVEHWAEAAKFVKHLDMNEMEALRVSCQSWWQDYKRNLHGELTTAVTSALG